MLSLPQSLQRSQAFRVLIVLFLLAVAAVSAVPNYFTNQWSWSRQSEVPHLSQLRKLQEEGLAIPEWQTVNQQKVEIGGHKWSVQTILPDDNNATSALSSPVVLMLRPQTWHRDQPQVDWMDINGVQQWTADSQRRLQFTISAPDLASNSGHQQTKPVRVQARFLRGWNQQQTYAVLQWYAWVNGGDSAPSQWFWSDQISQLRNGDRMPWVAVSILIPMKPLGDIELTRPLAESLGQAVQSALMVSALNFNS